MIRAQIALGAVVAWAVACRDPRASSSAPGRAEVALAPSTAPVSERRDVASVPSASAAAPSASAPGVTLAHEAVTADAGGSSRVSGESYRMDLNTAFDDVPDEATTWWEEKGAKWFKERLDRAKGGHPELLRLILQRHDAWGCPCPDYYFGFELETNTRSPWVRPEFTSSAPEPDVVVLPRSEDGVPASAGLVRVPALAMLVEGYLTGATAKEREFEVETFRVLRMRPARRTDLTPVVVRPDVPALVDAGAPDGRAFVLVADSFPVEDARSSGRAEARAVEIRAKGETAEVIDSTHVPGLFCCYLAVVVGRYADEREATLASVRLQKKGITAAVRRAF
jgi:hypothetical protein